MPLTKKGDRTGSEFRGQLVIEQGTNATTQMSGLKGGDDGWMDGWMVNGRMGGKQPRYMCQVSKYKFPGFKL